jgi:uncharacterized protein YndB with AHSA1/START domain
MSTHEFEVSDEITVDATPEQVWQAIATGPGVDAWFMGRNDFEAHEGGRVSQTMGPDTFHSTITAWEPGKRIAYRSDPAPDGAFMAFEYLIEGRAGGSTTVRFVHSGLLSGDDWETEYDALRKGDPMYLRQLGAYLTHFAGATAIRSVFAVGPQDPDSDRVWSAFGAALGLSGPATAGTPVHLTVAGLESTDGVIEFAAPTYVGVRTEDGLYLFMHGYQNTVVVQYHGYSGAQGDEELQGAWQSWLAKAFA